MGNSALLGVEIENNGSICAGRKMRGNLLLDVRGATSAEYLMFHFYGQERAHTLYAVTDSPGERCHKIARFTWNIFSSEVVLHRFAEGYVPNGRHVFPFEVNIPSGLPGTQSHRKGHEYFGIEYFCEAKLHRPGKFASDIKNSCEVLMNDEADQASPGPFFLGPIRCELFSVDALPLGKVMFGGKVNTLYAYGNETLRVNYAIHNESTLRVEALEFAITCHVGFKMAGKLCRHYKYPIFHKRIDGASIIGIEPLEKIGERDFDYNALLNQLNEGLYGVEIPIDEDIRPTYNSVISFVKYELSMTILTGLGPIDSTLRVPIIMRRRGAKFAGHVPQVEKPMYSRTGYHLQRRM
jgi:Arrestin (or S-antigen), N-terminal domain